MEGYNNMQPIVVVNGFRFATVALVGIGAYFWGYGRGVNDADEGNLRPGRKTKKPAARKTRRTK